MFTKVYVVRITNVISMLFYVRFRALIQWSAYLTAADIVYYSISVKKKNMRLHLQFSLDLTRLFGSVRRKKDGTSNQKYCSLLKE